MNAERGDLSLQEALRKAVEDQQACLQKNEETEPAEKVQVDGKSVTRRAGFSCYIEGEQTACLFMGGDAKHCYFNQAIFNHYPQLCEKTEDLKAECNAVLEELDRRMKLCASKTDLYPIEKEDCFSDLKGERHQKRVEILHRSDYK